MLSSDDLPVGDLAKVDLARNPKLSKASFGYSQGRRI
jgi:hypothetical protein